MAAISRAFYTDKIGSYVDIQGNRTGFHGYIDGIGRFAILLPEGEGELSLDTMKTAKKINHYLSFTSFPPNKEILRKWGYTEQDSILRFEETRISREGEPYSSLFVLQRKTASSSVPPT